MGNPSVVAGRYVLGEELGRGGMGVVRRAHDQRLARDVAVKLLDRQSRERPEALARFEYEARAAAALVHPNVVRVYDYGEDGDVVYLVMEALPGRTLSDEIARGRIAPERLVDIATDVLAGLAAAHDRGVVHRDIKPGNVLFDDHDRAKLGDFGVATSGSQHLTQTGLVLGTPAYVAPERLTGQRATSQSDLYALGVLCYEALSGERPFTGDAPLVVARMIERGEPVHLHDRCPDLPPALCDVVMRAMDREPSRRFASAGEFASALHDAMVAPDDRTVAVERGAPTAPATEAMARVEDRTRPMPVRDQPAPRAATAPKQRSRRPVALVAFLVVLVLAAGAAALAWYDRSRDDGPTLQGEDPELPAGDVRDAFDRLQERLQP